MNKTAIIALLICTAAFAQQNSNVLSADVWGKRSAPRDKSDDAIQLTDTDKKPTNKQLRDEANRDSQRLTGFRPSPFRAYGAPQPIYYDDKNGTYYTVLADGFHLDGHYDLTGNTKGKVRSGKITYTTTEFDARTRGMCVVTPEWGNSYVDKKCEKKLVDNFKEDLYNVIYKNKFEGKNIYKLGFNDCGGLGHCDSDN